MKILILGASGMAGSALVERGSLRGHEIFAASRSPLELESNPQVNAVRLDVRDTAQLRRYMSAVDVGIVALRGPAEDPEHIVSLTKLVLGAAAATDSPLVIVGGAGPLWSPGKGGVRVLDDPDFVPVQWRSVAEASVKQLEVCENHSYEGWVYASPSAVFEAGSVSEGGYVRGGYTLLVDNEGISRVTAGDMAEAVLDEIENPTGVRHFTVCSR